MTPESRTATARPRPPTESRTVRDRFVDFSKVVSAVVGSVWSFMLAILVIVVWAVTGPLFHYSDTWQLVINTGTTIVTFLMVFLIQSTQNRDAKAVHLKLDELIRALHGARDDLVNLENLSEDELERLAGEFTACSDRARETMLKRKGRGGLAAGEDERLQDAAETACEKVAAIEEKADEAIGGSPA